MLFILFCRKFNLIIKLFALSHSPSVCVCVSLSPFIECRLPFWAFSITSLTLNALRKTKHAYSFGLSECHRVNTFSASLKLYSEDLQCVDR